MTNLENNSTNNNVVDYDNEYKHINDAINSLKGNTASESGENLNSLNDNFLTGFKEFLDKDGNGEKKTQLVNSIKGILDSHKKEPDYKEKYKGLLLLAKALGISVEDSKKTPELGLKGELVDPTKLGADQTTEGKFFKGIDTKADGKEKSALDETKDKITAQIGDITKLLDNKQLNLPEGNQLEDSKSLLEKIQIIIANPIPDNVKILQNYIYENLVDGTEKKKFEHSNRYNKNTNSFDGQFGESTLKGLNKILDKTEEYIKSFERVESGNSEIQENKNITFELGSDLGSFDFKNWFKNLPENASITIEDSEKSKLSQRGEQNIKLNITHDGKTETIEVTVNVVEKETPLAPTPLELNNNQYQVMQNSSDLSSKSGLKGAIFYTNVPYKGEQPTDGKSWEFAQIPEGKKDYPCLMKLGNDIYNVNIDRNGNLCPTITNARSGAKILLENNASSINYLINKMPEAIKDDCVILWNDYMKDYVIRIKGQETGMTIEPMAIDGKGFGTDGISLENTLALLHFTEILRKKGSIDNLQFENKDPDLKWDNGNLFVKVKKMSKEDENSNSKHRYTVKLDRFGIGCLQDENIRRVFLKYNNHEDWNDNWDKKKLNKEYSRKKLDSQVSVVRGNNAGGESNNNSQSESNNNSQGESNNNSQGESNNNSQGESNNNSQGESNNNSQGELTSNGVVAVDGSSSVENADGVLNDLESKFNLKLANLSDDEKEKYGLPKERAIYYRLLVSFDNNFKEYFYLDGDNLCKVGTANSYCKGTLKNHQTLGGYVFFENSINVCENGQMVLNDQLKALDLSNEKFGNISVTIENGCYYLVRENLKIKLGDDLVDEKGSFLGSKKFVVGDKLKCYCLALNVRNELEKYKNKTELSLNNKGDLVCSDNVILKGTDEGLKTIEDRNAFIDLIKNSIISG